MKKLIIICASILLLLLLVIVFGSYFLNSHQSPAVVNSSTTFPTSSSTASSNQPVVQPVIRQALLNQIQNSNQINLGNAYVVDSYALQSWGDTNKGGDALLRYDQASGWFLVSMGGGEWDVPSLVQEGVPQDVAQQLVAEEQ